MLYNVNICTNFTICKSLSSSFVKFDRCISLIGNSLYAHGDKSKSQPPIGILIKL